MNIAVTLREFERRHKIVIENTVASISWAIIVSGYGYYLFFHPSIPVIIKIVMWLVILMTTAGYLLIVSGFLRRVFPLANEEQGVN